MSIEIRLREVKTSPGYPEDLTVFEHPSERFFYRPYLDDSQTLMILDLLERLKPRKCFEWGAGWSTIFFPSFIPEAEWISVEHRPFWLKILKPHLQPNTVLIEKHSGKDYVNEALNWVKDQPFDFVFVDGESRDECVRLASVILREGGIVIRHDVTKDLPMMVDGEDVRGRFQECGLIPDIWWGRK